jgi:RND family efflux transporter MFP subunit
LLRAEEQLIHATVQKAAADFHLMKANYFAAAGLGVLLLASAGCGKHPAAANGNALPPAEVRVQTVQSQTRPASEEVVATVRPKLSAVVAAKISGTVESLRVAPGQRVKAGELLAEISAQEIKARLDQATAVRDQATLDYARFQRLVAERAVSRQEYDAAESRQRAAVAAVQEAETMLGYTRVVAPFDGVVARKRMDVGDLATPGRPLLDLEDPAALRAEADIPETLVGGLKLGDRLNVTIVSGAPAIDGVVAEIAPAADPASRTVLVKLDLPAGSGARSGQFARVAVPGAAVNSLRMPASALVTRGQMESVFVAVNQRAQLRLVRTGRKQGDSVEIISGLSAGEAVVTEGAATLADGQPLTLRQ